MSVARIRRRKGKSRMGAQTNEPETDESTDALGVDGGLAYIPIEPMGDVPTLARPTDSPDPATLWAEVIFAVCATVAPAIAVVWSRRHEVPDGGESAFRAIAYGLYAGTGALMYYSLRMNLRNLVPQILLIFAWLFTLGLSVDAEVSRVSPASTEWGAVSGLVVIAAAVTWWMYAPSFTRVGR